MRVCPECGSEMVPGMRRKPFNYKGNIVALEVNGYVCPNCEEMILTPKECKRLDDERNKFIQQVNAGLVDSTFISSVRKKLGLDQKRAAELFGGGVNAFSRYEHGKAKPPLALIQLFRLLDKRPELLKELINE